MEHHTFTNNTYNWDTVYVGNFAPGHGISESFMLQTTCTHTMPNSIVPCTTCPSPSAVRRDYRDMPLREALETNEIILFYQPILDLTTQCIVAVEALVRWQHATYGLLPPAAFLPLAEQMGLLEDLDRHVLWVALNQAAHWAHTGQSLTLSINLTASSLQNPALLDDAAMFLQHTGRPPASVIIEVTEHAPLHNPAVAHRVLSGLRDMGLHVALDDFGNGYSPLTNLQHFPSNILKIDQSFVAGIGQNPRAEAILRAILSLGRELNLLVIAEGVETRAQLAWLQTANCPWAQGKFLGHPVPAELITIAVGATE